MQAAAAGPPSPPVSRVADGAAAAARGGGAERVCGQVVMRCRAGGEGGGQGLGVVGRVGEVIHVARGAVVQSFRVGRGVEVVDSLENIVVRTVDYLVIGARPVPDYVIIFLPFI